MRKNISFANNEYYHIYNRGADKRNIFLDNYDYLRFLRSINEFNQIDPIISLYTKDQLAKSVGVRPLWKDKLLVEIIVYYLNPNHFHLILKQLRENGISEFMKRVGGGYTGYFNHKNKRNGVLFQGKFKAVHIDSNEKLLYLSAYVNGNNKVHGIENKNKFRSSFDEYKKNIKVLCNPEIILDQFKTADDYVRYVKETVKEVHDIREDMKTCLLDV